MGLAPPGRQVQASGDGRTEVGALGIERADGLLQVREACAVLEVEQAAPGLGPGQNIGSPANW